MATQTNVFSYMCHVVPKCYSSVNSVLLRSQRTNECSSCMFKDAIKCGNKMHAYVSLRLLHGTIFSKSV